MEFLQRSGMGRGMDCTGMGWQPDLKDARDYHPDHVMVQELLQQLALPRAKLRRLPTSMDLREFLPQARDQGSLNASTAFAVLSLVEYFEARAHGRTLDASRLFLYQMTAKLMRVPRNSSVELRTTFKALIRFGTPPESYWPYAENRCQMDPTDAFLFSFSREFASIRFLRLDALEQDKKLQLVKAYLAAGFPIAFGFPVPNSLSPDGDILFRPQFDSIRGGQAVLAVGYDDRRRIASDSGAILIRVSWGTQWGEEGYGWMPYSYVTSGLAEDFWTTIRPDWVESGFLSKP